MRFLDPLDSQMAADTCNSVSDDEVRIWSEQWRYLIHLFRWMVDEGMLLSRPLLVSLVALLKTANPAQVRAWPIPWL
jgi:hypothetical protein